MAQGSLGITEVAHKPSSWKKKKILLIVELLFTTPSFPFLFMENLSLHLTKL